MTTQVQAFERDLCVALLHRERRTVRVTPAGKVVLRSAPELLALAERLETDVRQIGMPPAAPAQTPTHPSA